VHCVRTPQANEIADGVDLSERPDDFDFLKNMLYPFDFA
jgi:hypothetical protein